MLISITAKLLLRLKIKIQDFNNSNNFNIDLYLAVLGTLNTPFSIFTYLLGSLFAPSAQRVI